jgi:hypothetical protein
MSTISAKINGISDRLQGKKDDEPQDEEEGGAGEANEIELVEKASAFTSIHGKTAHQHALGINTSVSSPTGSPGSIGTPGSGVALLPPSIPLPN